MESKQQQITANQIQEWAQKISARSRLPVLLRKLVNSTGRSLVAVNFPGNDDAQRPGWDGLVEAGEATPWVPLGDSGWEFGTNTDIKYKADKDFQKSTQATPDDERRNTTFVFVTPRRWSGKAAWVSANRDKGGWKGVRAYDASDLEQWLEQSPSTRAWFADEARLPWAQCRSLDQCWEDWAKVTDPVMDRALFESSVEQARTTILDRLSSNSKKPVIITAAWTKEALAFLSQLFGKMGGPELIQYGDCAIVIDQPRVLPRLLDGDQSLIPIVFTRDVENELAPYAQSRPSVLVYPRNFPQVTADVELESVGFDEFSKALDKMGKNGDEIARLARQSGRSRTVLRRLLAKLPAVRTPEWASDRQIAASLVPLVLVGTWESQNESDQIALSLLTRDDQPYSNLETKVQELVELNDDPPIWSIGCARGVVSKIDVLHAIAGVVTRDDLRRFFDVAELVLGEDDPALDLPDDRRWMAALYGKTRESSSALREGICDTALMLAVEGVQLFEQRLGINTAELASRLVRRLLVKPLTTRTLETHDHHLPTYAEAAPAEFLSIIEEDLKAEEPAVLGLLRPAHAGGWFPSGRTGLLWALEALSWNPETLPRAACVLARLAQVEIRDNWLNKPINSLQAIFRAWMPQTAASLETRVSVINLVASCYPDVGWKLCVALSKTNWELGTPSYKPRWRTDGDGFGEPIERSEPVESFQRDMVELALTREQYTLEMLSDLVEHLRDLDASAQKRVWVLVESWVRDKASVEEKVHMREKLRVSTTLAAKDDQRLDSLSLKAREVYDLLEPSDVIRRHDWLFRAVYVAESAAENVEHDYQSRTARTQEMRLKATREIIEQRGFAGIYELAERVRDIPGIVELIGKLVATSRRADDEMQEFLELAVRTVAEGADYYSHVARSLISGALQAIADDQSRTHMLSRLTDDLGEAEVAHLLVLAPFDNVTWKYTDDAGEAVSVRYWRDVEPKEFLESSADTRIAVKRLLGARRPRAALWCVGFQVERLDAGVLHRVLTEVTKGGDDKPGEYLLDDHNVRKAVEHLADSPALTLEQRAFLEWSFLDQLDKGGSCIVPNLERYALAHPEIFVKAVVWACKRADDAEDPPEFRVPLEPRGEEARRVRRLLTTLSLIPGYDDQSGIAAEKLREWVLSVRQCLAGLGRAECGDRHLGALLVRDRHLGALLARASVGLDDVWPCEAVRQVMETLQSAHLMRGAVLEVRNARGWHVRGDGGDQERELARKFRGWSRALQVSHPYVASALLAFLADSYEREATREDIDAGIRRRRS